MPDPNAPAKKPPAPLVNPLQAYPTPDQGSSDVVAARMRERQQLDAMAGYRSTFVSGPRGPGGPSLADQSAQLDTTSALPFTPDTGPAPPPQSKATGSGGGAGAGAGSGGIGGDPLNVDTGGPGDQINNGGDLAGNAHANLTIGTAPVAQDPNWWKPKRPAPAGQGFYAQ